MNFAFRPALMASWVPEQWLEHLGCRIGFAPGGGRRLNAAMIGGDESDAQLRSLTAFMRSVGMMPVFQALPDSPADLRLAKMGFKAEALTLFWRMPATAQISTGADITLHQTREMEDELAAFFAAEGIGAARCAAMRRAERPHFIFAKRGGAVLGAAFVALTAHGAMLHALGVVKTARRQGIARQLLNAALRLSEDAGYAQLLWLAEADNEAASTLYRQIGAQSSIGYHYRVASK